MGIYEPGRRKTKIRTRAIYDKCWTNKNKMTWFSNDYPEDVLYLLTYSVIKEKKNTLKTSLIYGRSEIHKKEVQQIDKTLHFAINHLKKSDKINYVLNELINFNS